MFVGYSAVGWSENLDAFALSLKVEGLKPHTISCYVRDVRRLGDSVDWIPPAKVTSGAVRRSNWNLGRGIGQNRSCSPLSFETFFYEWT